MEAKSSDRDVANLVRRLEDRIAESAGGSLPLIGSVRPHFDKFQDVLRTQKAQPVRRAQVWGDVPHCLDRQNADRTVALDADAPGDIPAITHCLTTTKLPSPQARHQPTVEHWRF